MSICLYLNQRVYMTQDILNDWEKTLDQKQRVVLITGIKSYDLFNIQSRVEMLFAKKSISLYHYRISGEPSIDTINTLKKQIPFVPDLIIGLGGGSVLDTAKALSMILLEEGEVQDYLQDVGTKTLSGKKIPLWLCPTTAGTGSESTNNAVIADYDKGYKKSLRHNQLMADYVFIDCYLNSFAPLDVTVYSGMDALVQLLESYFSIRSNLYISGLCEKGIITFIKTFPLLLKDLTNISLREQISFSAHVSGVALSHVGLGLIHGFAGDLGGLSKINHGEICANFLFPATKLIYQEAYNTNNQEFLTRYHYLSNLLGEDLLTTLKKFHEFLPHPLKKDTISINIIQKLSYNNINRNSLIQLKKEQIENLLELRSIG